MNNYSSPADPSQFPAAPVAPPAPVAPANSMANPNDIWGNIGAGTYSALNEAGLGLPDFLAGLGDGETYRNLKKLREEHQTASDVGGLAGTIGGMFIPGMGAGKAATLLGKGATMAAKQAIPRALTDTGVDVEQGKDLGESLKQHAGEAALGIGGGALLNPVVSKVGEGAGKLAELVGKGFKRQMGSSLNLGIGVTDADIASKLTELAPSGAGVDAYIAKNVKAFQEGLAQYAKRLGLNSGAKVEQYVAKEKEILKPIEEAWNSSPPSNNELFKKLLSNPEIDKLIQSGQLTPAQIAKIGTPLVDKTGKLGKYWDVNNILDNQISNASTLARNATDNQSLVAAQSALKVLSGMKEVVRDTAKNLPGVTDEARDILANWKYRDVLVNAHTRNAGMQSASNTGGEGSFSRFGNAAIGSAALGGTLGAGAGALAPSDSGVNPYTGALAGVGASVLFPKAIPNAVKAIQSRASSALLPTAESKTAQGASLLSQLAQKAPSAAGAIPSAISQPTATPPSAKPTAQVPGLPTDVVASQAPINMGGEMVKLSTPPKVNFESPFGQRLIGSMDQIYKTFKPTLNGKPLSKQEMLDYYANATGSFDPSNPATIKLMTNNPEEQALLTSSIPRLNTLKDIDLNKVVDITANLPGGDIVDPSVKRHRENLIALLADINNKNPGQAPSKQEIDVASGLIDNIKNQRIPNEEKKAQLMKLLSDKGFKLDQLKSLGLY